MDGSGWWWFDALWMVVFWGLVIWGVVAVTRRGTGDRPARAALDDRFARGDIDEAEYRRTRDLISH
jgi:uncharacterized membrane protein